MGGSRPCDLPPHVSRIGALCEGGVGPVLKARNREWTPAVTRSGWRLFVAGRKEVPRSEWNGIDRAAIPHFTNRIPAVEPSASGRASVDGGFVVARAVIRLAASGSRCRRVSGRENRPESQCP